jgi:hypothetical protein
MRARDESGASLILAIVFMLVVGGIGFAVVSSVTSSVKGRAILDVVRNRQYAADGAIETAIVQIRSAGPDGLGMAACDGDGNVRHTTLDKVPIRVECNNASTLTFAGFLQRDVVLTACLDNSACSVTSTIIRAQVNFEGASTSVTRTWVQSWSVNG